MILSGNFHKPRIDVNDVMEIAQKAGVRQMDFKVVNVFGAWHHMTVPVELLTKKLCKEGIGFDGSSIGGYAYNPSLSDCRMKPDITTAFIDPFYEVKTISFICDTMLAEDPSKRHPFCPRSIAKKTENFLKESGLASKSWWDQNWNSFYLMMFAMQWIKTVHILS